MWNHHHQHSFTEDEAPFIMELSSSSNNTSTWTWDEADEIAFVLHEEQKENEDLYLSRFSLRRNTSLKKLLLPAQRRYHQRHVPHGVYYPFALAAW